MKTINPYIQPARLTLNNSTSQKSFTRPIFLESQTPSHPGRHSPIAVPLHSSRHTPSSSYLQKQSRPYLPSTILTERHQSAMKNNAHLRSLVSENIL
jgi:hypothetical protein